MRLIFLIVIVLTSCKPDLRILTQKESQQMLLNGERKFLYSEYVNENLKPISKAESINLNQAKSYRTFQITNQGEVKRVIVKPILDDSQLMNELKLVNYIEGNPILKYQDSSIDCDASNIDSFYHLAFLSDQNVRSHHQDIEVSEILLTDEANQNKVLPFLVNCGWPNNEKSIVEIWYIIQHSDIGLQCYYLDELNELRLKDVLPDSLFAKTYDRILTSSGLPQKYGTQKAGGRADAFHPIKDVEGVNLRRKNMGLCPIENKAKYWGFEFKLEDYINIE